MASGVHCHFPEFFFTSSHSFVVKSLGFSTYKNVSSVNRDSFTSSFLIYHTFYPQYLQPSDILYIYLFLSLPPPRLTCQLHKDRHFLPALFTPS